ncbi:YmaF family protein [Clostridium thermosuccinogenes]|uniref:YmaF family protein n=1 Tax=Clostridium thermosuccinogenes TaxID=84032 RepID=UPI003BEF204B
MHSHSFSGYTSYNNGHRHYYMGMTSISPDVPGHIHYMAGYTSFDDGHTHAYRSATGPAIYWQHALPWVQRNDRDSRSAHP